MSTNRDLVNALNKAAKELINRELSQEEVNQLVRFFNESSGTNYERALKALSKFTDQTEQAEQTIFEKSAASDNTNRVMGDLKDVIDSWEPDK